MKSSPTIDTTDIQVKPHEQDQNLAKFDFNEVNPDIASASKLRDAFTILHNLIKTTRDFLIKDRFFVDDFEIQLLGGQKLKRTAISTLVTGGVYSVLRSDYYIGVTNLSYALTIGLPRPKDVGIGKTFMIKDESAGAATTTITVCSYEPVTIEGTLTTTITTNYGLKTFITDGSNWFVGPS